MKCLAGCLAHCRCLVNIHSPVSDSSCSFPRMCAFGNSIVLNDSGPHYEIPRGLRLRAAYQPAPFEPEL